MAVYPETDKTMLERVISGDEISWNEFYETYAPVVKMLCGLYHVSNEAVEDVVQETMVHFSRQSGNYCYAPERARFRTYFNRIVRSAIIDEFRKEKKLALQKEPAAGEDPLQLPELEEEECALWRKAVMDELLKNLGKQVGSKSFLAFTMSTVEGHSISETAEFLQIPAAQVYVARSRCTAKLREMVRRCNALDPELALSLGEC